MLDGQLDDSVWGRGFLAAGGTIITLAAGAIWMRPAVYPFLVWNGVLPLAAAGVSGLFGAAVARLSKARWQGRPKATIFVMLLRGMALLVPGVLVGLAVLLLLRAGYLGYGL